MSHTRYKDSEIRNDIVDSVDRERARYGKIPSHDETISLTGGDPNRQPFEHSLHQAGHIISRRQNYGARYFGAGPAYTAATYQRYMESLGIDHKLESGNLLPTNGSTQGYFEATRLLTKDDVLLVPVPTYGHFLKQQVLGHTNVVPLQLREEDGYKLTPELLDREITRINKAYTDKNSPLRVTSFLNINPHNPTGRVYNKEDITALAHVMDKHGLRLIIDDMSHLGLEYSRKESDPSGKIASPFAAVPGMFDKTITLFSLSKAYSLVGMRAGLALGPKDFIGKMRSAISVRDEYLPLPSQGAMAGMMGASEQARADYLAKQAEEFEFRYYLLRLMVNGWDQDGEASLYMQQKGLALVKDIMDRALPFHKPILCENDNESRSGWIERGGEINEFREYLEEKLARPLDRVEKNFTVGLTTSSFAEMYKLAGPNRVLCKVEDASELAHIEEAYHAFVEKKNAGIPEAREKLAKLLKSGVPGLEILPMTESGFFALTKANDFKHRMAGMNIIKDANDLARATSIISHVRTLPGEAMGNGTGDLLLRISFSDDMKEIVEAISRFENFSQRSARRQTEFPSPQNMRFTR